MSKEVIDNRLKTVEIVEKLHKTIYNQDQKIADLEAKLTLTEKALELAVEELDDAKDMLRECNKNEFASLLNTSVDYFKARGKEIENDRK